MLSWSSSFGWSNSPADGHINVGSIMAYQAWLKETGNLDRILDPKEFLDTSYADAANRAWANDFYEPRWE